MSAVSSVRRLTPRRLTTLGLAALGLLVAPVPAQAGRLLVTGHDAEHHCSRDSVENRPGSCHFVRQGVDWVRAGADVSKPLLILDRGVLDFRTAIARAYGADPAPAFQIVDPRSPEFATLPLTTAAYSAILVASSQDDPTDPTPQDLNEPNATPDTDAINARAADIAAFYDSGGGVLVMSGGAAARANSASYYAFLGITRGSGAAMTPFSLTEYGRAIGWQDARAFPGELNDINCCLTHVSFEPPAPESPLKVAEQDATGRAVTLVADTPQLAMIREAAVTPGQVFTPIPGAGGGNPTTGKPKPACVPRKALRISLNRPRNVRFTKIVVYRNGKKIRTVGRRKIGSKRKTRAFNVKVAQGRTTKLRIVVTTASGRKLTFRQTYRPCRR